MSTRCPPTFRRRFARVVLSTGLALRPFRDHGNRKRDQRASTVRPFGMRAPCICSASSVVPESNGVSSIRDVRKPAPTRKRSDPAMGCCTSVLKREVRPEREGGDVPLRQVRRPDGGDRDRRPPGVPGPGAGPHPGQGARDHAVRRLVRQPATRDPVPGGGVRRNPWRRGAARDRADATTRAHRGHPSVGSAPAAALRGGPPRVPPRPWPPAYRRVHHPGVGDRPDPRAPPHPRHPRGARRAASPHRPGARHASRGASRARTADQTTREALRRGCGRAEARCRCSRGRGRGLYAAHPD